MKIEKGLTGYLRMGLSKVRFLPIFLPKNRTISLQDMSVMEIM